MRRRDEFDIPEGVDYPPKLDSIMPSDDLEKTTLNTERAVNNMERYFYAIFNKAKK
jgi:hypothetical protein